MQQVQKNLVEQQDAHLDEINEIAIRLKHHTKGIDEQVDKQRRYIDQLNDKIDVTVDKLNFVQKKLGKLLKTNDMSQLCTILILFGILVVMIFLVIYT